MKQLPDSVANVLGKLLADIKADAEREIERVSSEARTTIAELRAEVVELKAELVNKAASLDKVLQGARGDQGEKGERGEKGDQGDKGEKGDPGNDGRGISELMIDREGFLVVTMSDGSIQRPGPVVGADGAPGNDGLGFDDLDVQFDGLRTMTLDFKRAERSKSFTIKLAALVDRDVFKASNSYEAGDVVTYGGSLWIAQRNTTGVRPGEDDAFRLAVKRGRDGKRGEPGPQGPTGPKGDPSTEVR